MAKEFEIIEEICSECANIQSFPRSTKKKPVIFSVQNNWCYMCKKETNFFIVFDKNYAYNMLCEKEELNEKEFFIRKLLRTNISKYKEKKYNKKR